MTLMDRLFTAVANVVGFLLLVPYRAFAKITEDWISKPRNGGWDTSFKDQRLLELATKTAMDQALRFNAFPVAASAAMRFTRGMRIG